MEIKGKIDILVSKDYTEIVLRCDDSNVAFARFQLTAEQFCQALGRTVYTQVAKAEVFGLDKVGKKHTHRKYEFCLNIPASFHADRNKIAAEVVTEIFANSDEVPDLSFRTKDCFFEKDGLLWARTTVRKWT